MRRRERGRGRRGKGGRGKRGEKGGRRRRERGKLKRVRREQRRRIEVTSGKMTGSPKSLHVTCCRPFRLQSITTY